MSKQSSVQAKSTSSRGLTRSSASLLERQHTLGPHVCVQREGVGHATHPAAPSLVREVVDSPGRPLDAATRSYMEPRFGYDFSQVRVHTDDQASESARAVSARAYTAGTHVVFGDGQYTPGSPGGQRLLAHELTHVAQQASGPVEGTPIADGLSISHPGDRFERAARENGAGISGSREASAHRTVPAARAPRDGPLVLQRFTDTSPNDSYTQQATGAAKTSATAAEVSAGTGVFSALIGAYAAIRAANFAERSAQAAEDPPTAEPTTGGLAVTDADIPEIKALDTKKIGDPDKDPDSVTLQTGKDVETPTGQDVEETTGTDVETTKGKTKTTSKSARSTTSKTGTTTTKDSTSKVFKPPDKPDSLNTYKVLNINQGENDSADFYVSIRSNEEDIKDGGTEPPDAKGYLGGSSESNASVNFKARPGPHNPDGSATVRLLIGGTNAPPRKTLQSSGFLGGGGPEINKNYQVQRFSAVVRFDAHASKTPTVERANVGIGNLVTSGKPGEALVNVNLPDTYLPPGKRKDKK